MWANACVQQKLKPVRSNSIRICNHYILVFAGYESKFEFHGRVSKLRLFYRKSRCVVEALCDIARKNNHFSTVFDDRANI